jgi:hypothetical protein
MSVDPRPLDSRSLAPDDESTGPRRLHRRTLLRAGIASALALGGGGLVALPHLASAGPIKPVATPAPTPPPPPGFVDGGTVTDIGPTEFGGGTKPVPPKPTATQPPKGPICSSWRGPTGTLTNPFNAQVGTITILDFLGNPLPNAEIRSIVGGGPIGLVAGRRLEVVLAVPAREVWLTVVHYNPAAAQAVAYQTGVGMVDNASATPDQKIEQVLTLTNIPAIDFVVLTSPQSEVLLLDFCIVPA